MNKKQILGIILGIVGLAGVLSLLTSTIPLPAEAEAMLKEQFSPSQIKLLTLVNPALMLLIAVVTGTLLSGKTSLGAPVIEKMIAGEDVGVDLWEAVKAGLAGGLLAGMLLATTEAVFTPLFAELYEQIQASFQPSLAARFLYGGLTEEIIMRFGLMTLVVWLASRILGKGTAATYWLGIVVASLLFALGHLPIAFQLAENPPPSLIAYILVANSLGGLIFGWLYWKKGLGSAFVAHVMTHVVIVGAALLF